MSCSCDVHCCCVLGVCEDAIPRAGFVGGGRQITCPNPALHEVQHEVGLHSLLQQVLNLRRSADTQDERGIGSSVAAAELHLRRMSHLEPEGVDLSRSATERGEEDLQNNGVARSLSHKRIRRVHPVTGTWGTMRGLLPPVGSFTGDAP